MYLTPASAQTFSKFQNEKLSNFGQTSSAFIRDCHFIVVTPPACG
jgi:hypothetical protein